MPKAARFCRTFERTKKVVEKFRVGERSRGPASPPDAISHNKTYDAKLGRSDRAAVEFQLGRIR